MEHLKDCFVNFALKKPPYFQPCYSRMDYGLMISRKRRQDEERAEQERAMMGIDNITDIDMWNWFCDDDDLECDVKAVTDKLIDDVVIKFEQ